MRPKAKLRPGYCKKVTLLIISASRGRRHMGDSASESCDVKGESSLKILTVKTHPEELHVLKVWESSIYRNSKENSSKMRKKFNFFS